MSDQPYTVVLVPHPFKYNKKIRTVAGPGMIAMSAHQFFDVHIDQEIPEEHLEKLAALLNHVFLMGRRAVQSEMRNVLGIYYDMNRGFYLGHRE